MKHEHVDPDTVAAGRRRVNAAVALTLAVSMGLPMSVQAANALRVVRDPVTGELRGPTAAEVAAFEKAEAQLRQQSGKAPAPKAPVEIRHPDGSIETKLGDDSMMYSVVRANEDGTLSTACLPARQAQAFVKGGKAASSSKARTGAQP